MRVIYDIVRDGLSAISRASEALELAQRQVATGRRLVGPSSDPLASQQAVGEHAALARIDAYTRTRDAAASRLAATDNVLNGIVDKISASIVTATGARGSAVTQASRDAAAQSIRGLRDSLLGDLNAKFNGNALFAGTATDATAYAKVAGAWVYQGNAAPQQVEVEQDRLVSVSLNGQAIAQGSDATDLFTTLDDLEVALTNGDDAGIGTAMTALDRAFDRALVTQGRLGADERGVDDAAVRLSALKVAAETRRSKLEDADLAESVTRLTRATQAYQAALGAVSSAERISLLDYLR